jgi:hypothetical protein
LPRSAYIHEDIAYEGWALLGGTGNRLKPKTTAKLNNKQTSITTVQDLPLTFATFPAPLLSHSRLHLNLEMPQFVQYDVEKLHILRWYDILTYVRSFPLLF